MDATEEQWLWLLLVMQPHNPRTEDVLRGSSYDIKRACVQVRDGNFPFLNSDIAERARETRMGKIRELQALCRENDIGIITFDHPDYPEKLRLIDNPPIVLFTQGDIGCLKDRKVVAAVGTREPSDYSMDTAYKLCAQIAQTGAAVVSGLAKGLDTAAHSGALSVDGITLGVLACGSLVNYPAESRELKDRILGSDGVIISELLPGTKVPRGYFHMRNRLISGLSDSVVVLEAHSRSGALITANTAFEQKRKVFFIPPHDIMDKRYVGAAMLYRTGATPVFGYEDVLGTFVRTDNREETSAKPEKPKKQKPAKKSLPEEKPKKTIPGGLDGNSTKVYAALMEESLDTETLFIRTEIPYNTVLEVLMELEIGGLIERNPDGTYSAT